jgi:hypothetical protein
MSANKRRRDKIDEIKPNPKRKKGLPGQIK